MQCNRRTYLSSPMKVNTTDIKPMHMRGQHPTQKKYAIEHAIPFRAREHGDRDWREEDVDYGEQDAVEDGAHVVAGFLFLRLMDGWPDGRGVGWGL